MTEQPPSAGGRTAALCWLTTGGPADQVEDDLARAFDRFAEQRVSAETERCAKVAERFTEPRLLAMWDRPGGPPGNGWVPLTGKHVAAAIRAPERPAPEETT